MNLRRVIASNPWAVVGLAALGGWLLGSGVFTLPLPSLPSFGQAVAPSAPAPASTLPASSSSPVSQTSAAMPVQTVAADPFAGYDI